VHRLDADDANIGLARLDHGADPGEQAAAANRRDDRLHARRLLENLERDRALTRHHLHVVVRVDEREPVARGERFRFDARLREVRAVQHDGRAEMPAVRHLEERGKLRHDDRHRDAEQRAVICDAERVIAGGGRDDAALTLRRRKLQQRIACAALLEAAGALQVIELAMDVRAGKLRQRDRLDARRFVDAAANALARGFDVGDRKHVSPAGPSQGTDPRPLGGQRAKRAWGLSS
jgi:hypothetical protein